MREQVSMPFIYLKNTAMTLQDKRLFFKQKNKDKLKWLKDKKLKKRKIKKKG